MGRIYYRKVPGAVGSVYSCGECGTCVASADEIVSRAFHGRGGRAYLIAGVINVYKGICAYSMKCWSCHLHVLGAPQALLRSAY